MRFKMKNKNHIACLLLVSFVLVFQPAFHNKAVEKTELVYVYDPLCGWCYGFTPVMVKLKERYGDSLSITVLSGGMITGDRARPIGQMAAFIKQAYKEVEKTSGVKFGDAFVRGTLEEGKIIFSSLPPSIALTVFKSFNEKRSLEFAHAIQKMIYYEGKDPNDVASYTALLEPYNIDANEFEKRFKDPVYKNKTEEEFSKADYPDVKGYPTVFVKQNGKLQMITSGYDSYEKIEKKVSRYMK